jgi:hypothetical protein
MQCVTVEIIAHFLAASTFDFTLLIIFVFLQALDGVLLEVL